MTTQNHSQDPCNPRAELLAGHILGNLSTDEVQLLNEHPPSSAEEQALINELKIVHQSMAMQSPPPLSAAVKQRLLSATSKRRHSTPQNWLIAGLLLALTFTTGELYRSKLQIAKQTNSTVPADLHPGDYTIALQGNPSGTTGKARGEVTIRPGQQNNRLVLHHLPQAPAGMVYRLWAITPSGLQGCVHFLPDPSGTVVMTIPPQPTGSATKLLISLDPVSSREKADAQPEQPVLTGFI
ncbi:MAG: anti-sigma factor domain-containing protein [Synechococcus sp.]|uniref:anti-sigma factor n=1 Tax=Synechococcus sp. BMK-MC-1 TaxID=1442551 RepID=UPI001645D8FC|nr:anti-sigma factor [Synechococcus sp. BMK-MC-1]QNI67333.1 anti-sigma-K factor rskA family protein [Synechococcus sp. BMK-MC-1]